MHMTYRTGWTATMRRLFAAGAAIAVAGVAAGAPAAAQFRQEIANDPDRCASGAGPAVLVTVEGIRASAGQVRVQSYRATAADWLQKGRWINRIESRARAGSMAFCVPLPVAGSYGIAVRHDLNGNGRTDIATDGGGMSNNPAINIFNLGRPGYRATAISVGDTVRPIRIQMRYM